MSKTKNLFSVLASAGLLVSALILPIPIYAMTTTVSMTHLNSYITSNNFKLSYSALSDNPSTITAQFYVSKNGGVPVAFGSVVSGASGQVQVTSLEVSDQTNYTFSVTVSSSSGSANDSTSTFYDISGPSPVSGYYKDHLSGNNFKLHWKNPGDTDFAKVVIYRGDSQGFSADASHEIARVNGSPDADMTYDETVPDAAKTYYYAFRALDKAGNSSSLVGDSSVTIVATASPAPAGTNPASGSRVILPSQEANGGSVLGQETATDSQTVSNIVPEGENAGLTQGLSTKKKLAIAVVVIAAIAASVYLLRNKSLLEKNKKVKK